MKTEWVCTWSLIPAREQYVEKYASEEEAKTAMARRLGAYFDLKPYLDRMRRGKDPDRHAVADYLERFLSCLMFSRCDEEHMPCLEGAVECYKTEDQLYWAYDHKDFPVLSARESCFEEEEGLFVGFYFQKSTGAKSGTVRGIDIHVVERKDYGTSAYPLLVLFALGAEPATQGELTRRILEQWDTVVDRKAVGRHLQLLQDLGFGVQHGPAGYYRDRDVAPRNDIRYTPSAYPLLVWQVLTDTPQIQAEILRAVRDRYGARIDRKAIRRHLELLEALGVPIQKCKDGYYIAP